MVATTLSFQQQQAQFLEKAQAFQQIAINQDARIAFAESRAEVLLPLLPQQSTIRSIFSVETLAPGATPVYDIPFEDIEVVYFLPQIGGTPTAQMEGKQLSVDTFIVGGGVEFQEDIALEGRFQVGERATYMLLQNFIKMEELCGWTMIKNHVANLPSAQKVQAYVSEAEDAAQTEGQGKLNIRTLNEVITRADEMGVGGRQVTDLYVSPRRFNDLRNAITSGLLLPDSIKEQLYGGGNGTGSVSGIRIHKVWNRNLVSNSKGYAFTQKDGYKYGVMPIRRQLYTQDVLLAREENKIGIRGRAKYGFGVLDDKGLIEITF